MIFKIEDGILNVTIEQNLHSEDVVFKCFYWYTGKFSVEINKKNDHFVVSLKQKFETFKVDCEEIIEKIKQDLIDYKLRSIVQRETGTIRELIVAKAFAYFQETESPDSGVSDPVGFNPDHIQLYE
jgi:His-Xaa-Ser system protein HxsD